MADKDGHPVSENFLRDLLNHTDNYSETDLLGSYDNMKDYSNFLTDLENDLYRHNEPFTIVLIIFFSLTFVLGILGNTFVILVVAKHRSMRTLTNVFFLNLTIGDLLVVCVCIPITLGNYVYRDWVYGEVFCKVTTFLQGTAVGVSVLSMLFISINRYFAIHIPLRAKMLFTQGKVVMMLVSVWVVSFGAVSPLLFVNEITTWGIPGIFESRVCEEKWNEIEDKQFYNLFMFIIQFLLPLAVMCGTYIKISFTLWKEDVTLFNSAPSGKAQADRILRQRRRTVRNLMFLVSLFGLSWLPYYIVNIWLDFNVESEYATSVLNYIYPVVQLLGISNSTLNPMCYCFLSKGFRRAMTNMCCLKKSRTSQGTSIIVRYKIPLSDDSGFESVETVLS
ncbi:QRFP-like peptide receptor [Haliotis rufescens]|uniref:QRFP-like peptide receptor n=1 Tax=Haliotis rufescens TaxID=6454 RepID=UPI001EAFA326|nr:QRFP-like peptide receptor [Haliotis rufescens]